MISKDQQLYPQNSRVLGEFIKTYIPQHTRISIAAYPSFYLQQELEFRTNNAYEFTTEPIEKIIHTYSGEPLILLNPQQVILDKLQSTYPTHRLYTHINNVQLHDILLFVQQKNTDGIISL